MKSGGERPDAQQDVIAFLRHPASYGLDDGVVEVVETHCSMVFLAGDRAYKLKRAVKYPYLDFSTPALRQAGCTAAPRPSFISRSRRLGAGRTARSVGTGRSRRSTGSW